MVDIPSPDPILDRLQRLHPKLIDLSLGRMHRLLARLGNPEQRVPPVIHVAGTNGKGSTVAYLRAMHEAAGRRVHVYTSPHLVRFNERIVLSGVEVDDQTLVDALEEAERANDGEPITYFEITTAVAFLLFARVPADLLLLEVGLGGRLDSTNVIDAPALSVITPVAMDHMQFLGDTLAKIAGEKAGVLKPGAPAVIARQEPDALEVIRARAASVGADLSIEGEDWRVSADGADGLRFEWSGTTVTYPRPSLLGAHQIANAGTALAAAHVQATRFLLTREAMSTGLKSARWPARMQRLIRGPVVDRVADRGDVWLDGGHNAHAAEALAVHLAAWRAAEPGRRTVLVYGCLENRNPATFLGPLAALAGPIAAVPIPGEHRAFSPADVAERAAEAGIEVIAAEDVATAVIRILERTDGPIRVLICGSLYLAGAVLSTHG